MKRIKIFKASTHFFSILLLVRNFIYCKTNVISVEASLLDSFTISANEVEIKNQVNNFCGSILQIPAVLFWGLKNDQLFETSSFEIHILLPLAITIIVS